MTDSKDIRSLASAPADQSDAFRHGIDGTDTDAWLRRQVRREGKLVKALKAAKPMLQNFAGDSPDNERIYNLVCDAIECVPDQSDAGRDVAIEDLASRFHAAGIEPWAIDALRALKSAAPAEMGQYEPDAVDPMLLEAHLEYGRESAKAQLSAAPAECTCHPDDNPPRPCPQKYALSDCRSAADRAAIREALKEASRFALRAAGDDAKAICDRITAALALLGEG